MAGGSRNKLKNLFCSGAGHPKKFCVKANPKDKEWLAKQALFGIPY